LGERRFEATTERGWKKEKNEEGQLFVRSMGKGTGGRKVDELTR